VELKDKSVLVTGGAGFIGSHLVDRLILEQPSNLVIVDNLFMGRRNMKYGNLNKARINFPRMETYIQDASDPAEMERIIQDNGTQVVFNLAVVPLLASLNHPRWCYSQNVDTTLCLCELAMKRCYDTLIHFSSSEVYGTCQYTPMDESHPFDPTTPYGASKAASDMLVLSYIHTFGIDASIIRPFNQYGPRQSDRSYAGIIPLTIKRILAGEAPMVYGDGEQTRDFTYVGDTIDATMEIYRNTKTRGKVVNIGNGRETSISTLVRLLAQCLGCDKPIVYEDVRTGDVSRHIADIRLAKELIRFKPIVGLEDGLRRTVEWYKDYLNKK